MCPQFTFAQQESKLKQAWEMLQARLDSSTIRKFDSRYIEVPDKPWRLVLRGKSDDFNMKVDSYFDDEFISKKTGQTVLGARFDWHMMFDQPMAQSIGFYAGYRGLGFSYSYYLRKKTGRAFAFSSTGARYGLNFRLRRFSTHDVGVDAAIKVVGKEDLRFSGPGTSPDPFGCAQSSSMATTSSTAVASRRLRPTTSRSYSGAPQARSCLVPCITSRRLI